MAKILRQDSDFHKRFDAVMRCMEENNVSITFLANEFRFSDSSNGAPQVRQNMVLEDIEGQPIYELPAFAEWRLRVFNS